MGVLGFGVHNGKSPFPRPASHCNERGFTSGVYVLDHPKDPMQRARATRVSVDDGASKVGAGPLAGARTTSMALSPRLEHRLIVGNLAGKLELKETRCETNEPAP